MHFTRRFFIASGLATWATATQAAATPYVLVKGGSTIAFAFSVNGDAQSGTVPVETADIMVNLSDLSQSTADVTANIQNARTGFLLATQALKSPEVLDATAHPIVRFTSTRIKLGAQGRISEGATIEGALSLRGETRTVLLDARLSRPAGTAPDDLSVLFIHLEGAISRSEFGATGYASFVADRVGLDIRAEIRARA